VRRATMLIVTVVSDRAIGPDTTLGYAVVCAPADGNGFILITYTIKATQLTQSTRRQHDACMTAPHPTPSMSSRCVSRQSAPLTSELGQNAKNSD